MLKLVHTYKLDDGNSYMYKLNFELNMYFNKKITIDKKLYF